MPKGELLERLKLRVGKPAATLVATNETSERYLITEVTLSAVTLFLLSKYLDGFAEGLGIKQLGKEHAQLTLLTLDSAIEYVTAKMDELQNLLARASTLLNHYRDRSGAKAKAEASVSEALSQRGVPAFEASDIAAEFTEELFNDS
jgi:hypothetical protein